jgi:hypothetical protein
LNGIDFYLINRTGISRKWKEGRSGEAVKDVLFSVGLIMISAFIFINYNQGVCIVILAYE